MPQTSKTAVKPKAQKKGKEKRVKANKSSKPDKFGTSAPARDAIDLLKSDHREVEKLFEQFESARGNADKRKIANAICVALKVHARLEEEIFYPAAYSALDDKSLIQEAQVEHASAKDLIAQIESGAPGEAFYEARVKVLAEYIDHHVTEEEDEMFPRCRDSKMDLTAVGATLAMRKQELMTGFLVSNPILALS